MASPSRPAPTVMLIALLAVACGADDDGSRPEESPGPPAFYPGHVSPVYSDPALWICRPGSASDHCSRDLDATELLPDGSRRVVPHVPAQDAPFDCFYVHPTTESVAGLDEDLSEPNTELDPILNHAARFNGLCKVYAPFYRQVGITAPDRDALMPIAYGDVLDAFKHYMANDNRGRPFALMGHSQGTRHLSRLVAEEFDPNPDLSARLVSAMLIGGGVTVEAGKRVGGSFENVPVCAARGEAGCVIHYNTFPAEAPPQTLGLSLYGQDGVLADGTPTTTACIDPQAIAGTSGRLAGSYFPTSVQTGIWPLASGPAYDGIETPFVLFRDAFRARCVATEGFTYYEVAVDRAAGDVRTEFPHRVPVTETLGFGMHTSDWQIALGDLLVALDAQWATFSAR